MKHRIALSLAISIGVACSAACRPVTRPVLAPGARAPQFLTAERPRMVIEATSVNERGPDPDAIALMLQRARERCQKPEGVMFVNGSSATIAPTHSGTRRWTIPDLQAIESAHRMTPDADDTAVLYLLYVDGEHAGNPLTLGLSYGDHSIAIFKDKVGSLEPAALVHELGHQLGLVNSGTPMQQAREDLEHRGHDRDARCVMYWQLRSTNEWVADDFDDGCKYDLKAAGGK